MDNWVVEMDKDAKTIYIAFAAGIILVAIILALNSGQTKIITLQEQKNAISVSGNARLEVEPDMADVYVKIETFSESAQNAKDENAKISNRVTTALKKEGVKKEEIETSAFSLNPRYRYKPETGESILEGYTLTNVLKINTKDISKAGKIIDISVDNGANGIERASFGLTKEKQKEVSGEALIKASTLAKEKAESIASGLGIRLGKIISVQVSSFNFIAFDYAPRAEVLEAKAATEIVPGKVEVTAFVSLSYEISQ